MIELEIFLAVLAGGAIATLIGWRAAWRADRRLRSAIAALPAGIAFYDADDRLYLWNDTYKDVSGGGGKLLRRGVRFRELLEEDLRTGHYAEAEGPRGLGLVGERRVVELQLVQGLAQVRELRAVDWI